MIVSLNVGWAGNKCIRSYTPYFRIVLQRSYVQCLLFPVQSNFQIADNNKH